MQARSLRWKQLVLEAIKMALTRTGSDSDVVHEHDACPFASVWITTGVLGMLCTVAVLHMSLCAALRTVYNRMGRQPPKFTTGTLSGATKEAAVAVVVLPGAWFPIVCSDFVCLATSATAPYLKGTKMEQNHKHSNLTALHNIGYTITI